VERDADGRLLVVADASFLINFLVLDRVDILGRLAQFRFHLVNHVRAEIRYEDQRARLQAALERTLVTEIEITDPGEARLYDEFRGFLGDGESASLAVAVNRRWVIAADEKGRFRREVFARLGEDYLLNTLGALLTAIRTGVITVAEAEALRMQLRAHRFEKDLTPFDELLRNRPDESSPRRSKAEEATA
jgi:predicted nucleic acid-binding protein